MALIVADAPDVQGYSGFRGIASPWFSDDLIWRPAFLPQDRVDELNSFLRRLLSNCQFHGCDWMRIVVGVATCVENALQHLGACLVPSVKSIKEDAAVVADAYRQRAVLLYQRQRQDGDQHGETIPETAQASRETSRWLAQSQPLLASFCSFGKLGDTSRKGNLRTLTISWR